jgi:starch-binding outer membrane protein, SusD/RagB family
MKRKIITYYICVVLLGFSCTTEFLDIAPQSTLSTETFYQTSGDFDNAIAAAYDQLRSYYLNGVDRFEIIEGRSDDLTGNNYYHQVADRFTDNASHEMHEFMWDNLFKGVAICNAVITNIEDKDVGNKQRVLGEAHFLRGFFYAELVKIFGGVPLYDGVKTRDEYYTIPRSTIAETYKFIYDDFEYAASNLPASYSGGDIGRATSWAAKGLLAKAYLYNGDKTAALPLLNDIISNGNFEWFTNWADIFDEDNDNGPQALFQIQCTSGGIGQGNPVPFYLRAGQADSIYNRKFTFSGGGDASMMAVSKTLLNSWEPGDIRKELTIAEYHVQVTGDKVYFPLIYKFTYGAEDPPLQGDWGINWTVLRYTEILLMKAECILDSDPTGARTILNQVRNRAGLADLDPSLTGQDLFNALVRERRHELAFEGHRWFDLVRWDMAVDTINSYLDVQYPTESGFRMNPDKHQYLFPIPLQQINTIGDESVLWQNPGWF